jgi:hypothetical protein
VLAKEMGRVRPNLRGEEILVKNILKVVSLSILGLAACALPAFAGRPVPTPEPVTMVLLAAGIGGVAVIRRIRK